MTNIPLDEAAARVRTFIEARKAYRSRLNPHIIKPSPDRIIAEYGYLDMNDLQTLVDAAGRS